jgi:hypothetical protein
MTPFAEAPTRLRPTLIERFSARRAPLVFVLCILVGLTMVVWRAKGRLEVARALARTEARACGASLELQFSQSPAAVEALGMLAKQGRAGLANSTRLQEVLRRAQLGDLSRQGYVFALYIQSPAQQKPVVIASQGLSSLLATVQQPVRAQNTELRLALKPKGGWIDKIKVGLESLAVLLMSGIISLSVNLLESRRAMEVELKEATQRLARETVDRSQAQADCTAAKEKSAAATAELSQTQLALQKAESKAAQLQIQLDASARGKDESAGNLRAELSETHSALKKAEQTIASATQSEKDAASVAQEVSQEYQAKLADLQVRLEVVTRSARDSDEASATRVAQLERSNRELQERLFVAEREQARVAELAGLLQKSEEEVRNYLSEHARPDLTDLPTSKSASSASSKKANSTASDGIVPPTESSPVQKGGKASRRKQARRDDQLPLFGNEVLAVPPTNRRNAEAETQAPEEREPRIPIIEIAAPANALSFNPLETSTEQARSEESTMERSKTQHSTPQPTLESESAEVLQRPISSSVTLDVPATESLAPNEVLADAGDDPKQDLEAFRQFLEEHTTAPGQIRDALLQGDLTAAQRMVQAVKIAAHEIGANAVHKAATALARACQERSDPTELESVWGELDKELSELAATFKPAVLPKEAKPSPPRRLPSAPPVDPAQLRKAVSQILPLLAERDPGAKDCLKDNRTTFRSAFTAEAYVEFEHLVKSGSFDPALEQLRKAVRKYGLSI